MYRTGKFDVTDDSNGHVNDARPIRKSLSLFRPDKYFLRCANQHPAAVDTSKPLSPLRPATSDGTSPPSNETENDQQKYLSATSEVTVTGYQPVCAAFVSKVGGETGPEVVQVHQRNRSFEPAAGSLRSRWRLLNDEFKQLYQQRDTSQPATPTQGQTKVTNVRKFKDIDRRFSCVSRAVSNMSARQLRNTTSGRTDLPEVTSSRPDIVVRRKKDSDEERLRLVETATLECQDGDDTDNVAFDHLSSAVRHKSSLPDGRTISDRQHLPVTAGTEPLGWYPVHQSTVHRQSDDGRLSASCLYCRRLADRSDNSGRRTEHVLPSRECEYKTACKDCWRTMTSSPAAAAAAADDDRSLLMKRSRDTGNGTKQQFGMVISAV